MSFLIVRGLDAARAPEVGKIHTGSVEITIVKYVRRRRSLISAQGCVLATLGKGCRR